MELLNECLLYYFMRIYSIIKLIIPNNNGTKKKTLNRDIVINDNINFKILITYSFCKNIWIGSLYIIGTL